MTRPSAAIPIGALSSRTGCNIETIRYYERVGLLPPPARSAAGYRLYSPGLVDRLAFIRRARALGFTLEEVRALLRLAESRSGSCGEARDLATAHLADIRAKIADLRAMGRVLEQAIKGCADGNLPNCPLMQTLSAKSEEAGTD